MKQQQSAVSSQQSAERSVQHRRLSALLPTSRRADEPGRGFTLIEMLVVLIIFGGIMGALLIAFLIGKSSFLSADAYIQVQQGVRQAFDTMVKEIREANPTGAPPGPWGVTVSSPGPVTGTQVDFAVALGYNQPTVCDTTVPQNPPVTCCQANQICYGAQDPTTTPNTPRYRWRVQYQLDTTVTPNRLIRRVLDQNGTPQGVTQVLSNNAAQGNFTYDAANKTVRCRVEVALTGASAQQLPGGTMSSGSAPPLETTVRLRN